MLQLAATGDANQHARRFSGADEKLPFSADSRQSKVFAAKQSFSQHRLDLFHHRHDRTNRTLVKINAGQRLIELQWSRLTGLGIDVVPIVQTKRHVAVFLHFEHDHVAERVNRPGRHEGAIAELGA